jgi:hypothetical protein
MTAISVSSRDLTGVSVLKYSYEIVSCGVVQVGLPT